MIKRINIEVDSTEDNSIIESYIKKFLSENFQKYKEAKIIIDNVIPCPICKDNELIPLPAGAPMESYYCHFCNKDFKKEEVENASIPK